jgi:hypothetical protein
MKISKAGTGELILSLKPASTSETFWLKFKAECIWTATKD